MNCNKEKVFLRKAVMIIMVPIVLSVAFLLQSCVVSQVQRAQYLADQSNYSTINGIVAKISYSDDKSQLFISLDGIIIPATNK